MHLAWRDAEKRQVGVGHADSLDQSVQGSLRLLPNLIWGSPENDCRVAVCLVKELIRSPDHPEHACVGHDPQSGAVPDVRPVAQRGSIVHANHALRSVDLVSRSTTQDVAGARYQRTVLTV